MHLSSKNNFKKVTKYILAGALTFGIAQISSTAFAQSAPPPPPPPNQVFKKIGADFKKINPFKKGRKAPAPPGAQAGPPAGGPPPPPNPLNLFKKKSGGSPPAPPKPPGAR